MASENLPHSNVDRSANAVIHNQKPVPVLEILSPDVPNNGEVSGLVHIKVKASPDDGFKILKISGNPGPLPQIFQHGDTYERDWDTSNIKSLNTSLDVQAFDDKGQVASVHKFIHINNQNIPMPTVSIASPRNADTVKGDVLIEVHVTGRDDVDSVEISLPSGETAYPMKNKFPYTWNWQSAGVPDGSQKIKARACDKAGHCGSSEIEIFVRNAS